MTDSVSMSQPDVVVYGIKRMILAGELHPHDRLPTEKDLAASLGVSRNSLREGLHALSIMGIVETRQGAGTTVTALDASLLLGPMEFVVDLQHSEGLQEVHRVRRVLETWSVQQAARRITDDELEHAHAILDESEVAMRVDNRDHETVLDCDVRFHHLIAQSAGNAVLTAMIDALSSKTIRGRMWRAITDEQADLETLREHRAILDALRARDPEIAAVRMAAHLLAVEQFLRDQPPADEVVG